MTVPIFELPDELRLSLITKQFPCREPQIRALATLLNVRASHIGELGSEHRVNKQSPAQHHVGIW